MLLGWLSGLDDRIHCRFANKGLVPHRERAAGATLAAYKETTDSLLEVLGRRTPVTEITPADEDHWRKAFSEKGDRRKPLAAATIGKRVHVAKCIFSRAWRWKLVPENLLEHPKAGSQSNPDRANYISKEDTQRLLDACPDIQWQALIGVLRYAGLRCPSEVRELKWSDINWDQKSLTVRSPKTQANPHHSVRIVPVSQELQPILLALFDSTEEGTLQMVPVAQKAPVNIYAGGRRSSSVQASSHGHAYFRTCAHRAPRTGQTSTRYMSRRSGLGTARRWRQSTTCSRGTCTSRQSQVRGLGARSAR